MSNRAGRLGATIAAVMLAACGASELLGPDAAQGVEGIALRGPMCPVQSQQDPCPDEPYQARVVILDADGDPVATFVTGEDGRFRVGLVPGRYTLDPESGNPFPVATPVTVDVVAGVWSEVTLSFDTGIR